MLLKYWAKYVGLQGDAMVRWFFSLLMKSSCLLQLYLSAESRPTVQSGGAYAIVFLWLLHPCLYSQFNPSALSSTTRCAVWWYNKRILKKGGFLFKNKTAMQRSGHVWFFAILIRLSLLSIVPDVDDRSGHAYPCLIYCCWQIYLCRSLVSVRAYQSANSVFLSQ